MSGIATSSLLPDPPHRRHEEADLQRSVHQYLRWALPDDALHFAIPNGLMRSRKTREMAQGTGVVAGVPDLAVIWRGKALFLELKTAHGVVSAAQRSFHRRLAYCGSPPAICRTPEEAEQALRAAGLPLRATVSGWLTGGGVG